MNLTEIEASLRQLADYIRDNPDKKKEILAKIVEVFQTLRRQRTLQEPSLLEKKQILETQKTDLESKIADIQTGIATLGDTGVEGEMKAGLQFTVQQYQGAVMGIDRELNNIDEMLKVINV